MTQEEVIVITMTGKKNSMKYSPDQSVGEFVSHVGAKLNLPSSTIRLLFSGRELKPRSRKMAEFCIGKYGNYVIHLQTTTVNVVDNDDVPSIPPSRKRKCGESGIDVVDLANMTGGGVSATSSNSTALMNGNNGDITMLSSRSLRIRARREMAAKEEQARVMYEASARLGSNTSSSNSKEVIDLLSDDDEDNDCVTHDTTPQSVSCPSPKAWDGMSLDVQGYNAKEDERKDDEGGRDTMRFTVSSESSTFTGDVTDKIAPISLQEVDAPFESKHDSRETTISSFDGSALHDSAISSSSALNASTQSCRYMPRATLALKGEKRALPPCEEVMSSSDELKGRSTRLLLVHSESHFPDSGKRLSSDAWLELNTLNYDEDEGKDDSNDKKIQESMVKKPDSTDLGPTSIPPEDQVWIIFSVLEKERTSSDCCSSSASSLGDQNVSQNFSAPSVENDNGVYHVTVGRILSCSCYDNTHRKNLESDKVESESETGKDVWCSHMTFILHKVLGVGIKSPLFSCRSFLQLEVWSLLLLHDPSACENYHSGKNETDIERNNDTTNVKLIGGSASGGSASDLGSINISNNSSSSHAVAGSESQHANVNNSNIFTQSVNVSNSVEDVSNNSTEVIAIDDNISDDEVSIILNPKVTSEIVEIDDDDEDYYSMIEDNICCCCFEEMKVPGQNESVLTR